MNCSETVEFIYTELLYLRCIYLQINSLPAGGAVGASNAGHKADIIRTIKLQ